MTDLYTKLEELADLRAAPDALRLELDERIRAMLGDSLYSALKNTEAEYSAKTEAVTAEAAALEAEIKAEVLDAGQSVKSAHLMAVYNKGRVTWDGKQLEGMMALIPGLAAARKKGEPTVSFRAVK